MFRRPPFLCVEIVSREGRTRSNVSLITLHLGYRPHHRWAQIYEGASVHEMKNGRLWSAGPEILVPFQQFFD
jgi:hypothetical protein